MNEDNVIKLVGSEGWKGAYAVGKEWVAKFPDQDADELAYCMEYNEHPLKQDDSITKIMMLNQGERDGSYWIWYVSVNHGQYLYVVVAGCDYTGWDCQAWSTWQLIV